MAPRHVPIWLLDIRGEIAGIRGIAEITTVSAFAGNWILRRAVEHALLIIAEAAKHIPADMKASHPEVPWSKIHGLGNMLRHEYRRVDPMILWSVMTDHIGPLDRAVAAMLAKGEQK